MFYRTAYIVNSFYTWSRLSFEFRSAIQVGVETETHTARGGVKSEAACSAAAGRGGIFGVNELPTAVGAPLTTDCTCRRCRRRASVSVPADGRRRQRLGVAPVDLRSRLRRRVGRSRRETGVAEVFRRLSAKMCLFCCCFEAV